MTCCCSNRCTSKKNTSHFEVLRLICIVHFIVVDAVWIYSETNDYDWRRFEEKLAHLRKQATFKTDAMAEEIEAIRTAIAENERLYDEVRHRVHRPAYR